MEINEVNTLTDALDVIQNRDTGIHFIYSQNREVYLPYSELYHQAKVCLYQFQKRGLVKGDELVFQIVDNQDFIRTLWACLLGGIIPIPVTTGNSKENGNKVAKIWEQLSNPHLIISPEIQDSFLELLDEVVENKKIIADMKDRMFIMKQEGDLEGIVVKALEEEIAYVQFSSGSTGDPKGVTLSHKNIMTNVKAILKGCRAGNTDISISWMPLTHDMGLIGMHFTPLVLGANQYIMTPTMFVKHPQLFLEKITEHKATITSIPNFGYSHMLQKMDNKNEYKWELSSLKVIFNGAEMISYHLVKDFMSCMKQYGLKEQAMFPVYGMAEASLAITFSTLSEGIKGIIVERSTTSVGQQVIEAAEESEKDTVFVDLGYPVDNCQVRIVDDKENPAADHIVGNIQIRGDNVTKGYYHREDLNTVLWRDGWLDTGDVGFFRNNSLVVLGRTKEVIIVNGQNYYATDLERIAGRLSSVKFSDIAVAGYFDGTMEQILVFVAYRGELKDFELAAEEISLGIFHELGLSVTHVIPIKKMPKTTSGKTQRYKLLEEYRSGIFDDTTIMLDHIRKVRLSMRTREAPITQTEEKVMEIVKAVVGAENIGITDDLFYYSLQSVAVMQIYDQIETLYPGILKVTDIYRFRTIKEIASALNPNADVQLSAIKRPEKNPEGNHVTGNPNNDIAVIGLAVKLPMADTAEEFWSNLKYGIESIVDFPDSRVDKIQPYLNLKYDGPKQKFMQCGFLNTIDQFDYDYFGLSPKEAELTDPLHRLFFETAITALETAGYNGEGIDGSNTGIFIGAFGDLDIHSYKEMVRDVKPSELPLAITGTTLSMMGGRLANFLNLHGPVEIVDTACSSSLVAVHEACQALKNNKCDMALACGARIQLMPLDDSCYKIGIESSDGTTRTFDSGADGSGYGEGIVVLLMKPLDKAIYDGDYIHGVIKGSAVNHDGRSLRLTAPNPEAQENVLLAAWADAGITPEQLSYIECHGTGTKVGDPIEIDSLVRAFSHYTDKKQFCAIGSVKSNLGHLLDCSGITGLAKAILSLEHAQIPPSINFQQPNALINFIDSPLYVNTTLKAWNPSVGKRYCGISSFGISGVNCHMVLEEAPDQTAPEGNSKENDVEIFTLSAKSETALLNTMKAYVSYLKSNKDKDFTSICYTSNTGKRAYQYRVALLSESGKDLRSKLIKLCEGGLEAVTGLKDVWYGKVSSAKKDDTIDSFKYVPGDKRAHLTALCEAYVKGSPVDWKALYGEVSIARTEVPAYQFDRKSCWLKYPITAVKEPSDDIFYQVRYAEVPLLSGKRINAEEGILVIQDNSIVMSEVIKGLKDRNYKVLTITAGGNFEKTDRHSYTVQLNYTDFSRLLEDIDLGEYKTILYAPTAEIKNGINSIDDLSSGLDKGFLGLFDFIQAYSERKISNKINILVITDSAYEVTGKESRINPQNAALVGFSKTVNQEFSTISCKVIDIADKTEKESILKEIEFNDSEFYVALREDKRFVEEFAPMQTESLPDHNVEIKDEGVYLITGGLGKMGLCFAEYLASLAKGIKLILVSRSSFPSKDQWEKLVLESKDKQLTKRLDIIQKLTAKGHDITVYQADISIERDVNKLILDTQKTYGNINGIIHCAGITGNGLIVSRKKEDMKPVIAPKIFGTWLLHEYTKDLDLDFFVLCSSGVGISGEIGLADYAAANSFLDSFAQHRARSKSTLAIDWVVWKSARMMEGFSKNVDGFFLQLTPEKAIKSLDIVLKKQVNRVLIGEINYESPFLKHTGSILIRLADEILKKLPVNHPETESSSIQTPTNQEVVLVGKQDYTEVEKTLSKIVGEVLGYSEINIFDNFFEMGGNSILLNYIWKEIDNLYPNRVMISDMFAYPTIHVLAVFIMKGAEPDAPRQMEHKNMEEEIDNLLQNLQNTDDIDRILGELKSL
jgi:acyl transferase domain-containing protein/acyl-CoA synthetase (AMP-forming)/AMP-acid ligase II